MNRYNYVLLDLDGTITDPKEGITKGIKYALDYYGIEVDSLETLCKFIGPPLNYSFQEYYNFSEDKSKEAVDKYREYYGSKGIYENILYDGMEDFLKELNNIGVQVMLATSKPQVYAEKILEHFHIDEYFTFIGGSNLDLSRNKKEEVIKYVIEENNLPLEEVVMVGDREYDIIGAKKNNISSIGVLYGYGDKEELENAGADYIASNLLDLKKIICLNE